MKLSLEDPLVLPCGAIIPNRLGKSALVEELAAEDGTPTQELERLYALWSEGGAGLLMSGAISVDRDHRISHCDIFIDGPVESVKIEAWKRWTVAATKNGNQFWAQLAHAGRQTDISINPKPKAPSAVKVNVASQLFGSPVPMSGEDIDEVITKFVQAAKFCKEVGFTGVQLHSAHGYLLSQFLSPLSNKRTDKYGGSLQNRARLLLDLMRLIRKEVGPDFPISVKLNSADFQRGGFDFQDSLQVEQWLEEASIDLIEISGGAYERIAFLDGENDTGRKILKDLPPSTQAREAYFADFAKAMKETVKAPLMVTGGFRSRAAMMEALDVGAANIIGLGRPLCIMTDGPKKLLQGLESLPRYEDELHLIPNWLGWLRRFQSMKFIDLFACAEWFIVQIQSIARTGRADTGISTFRAHCSLEAQNKEMASHVHGGPTVS